MNCYTHHEKNAVGLYKSCGRGLCPECAVEVEDSLSCLNRCEDKVRILNRMVKENAQILSTSNKKSKDRRVIQYGYWSRISGFWSMGV